MDSKCYGKWDSKNIARKFGKCIRKNIDHHHHLITSLRSLFKAPPQASEWRLKTMQFELRPYQAAAVQSLRLGLGVGAIRELPPVELLRDWFSYDADAGRLIWKKRSGNKATAGVVAGNKQRNGYRYIEFQGKAYREHRLVWAICKGEIAFGDLDHINGVRDDNRIENLRDIGRSGNAQNERKARKSNRSTGVLGVYKAGNKFRAIITANGKRTDLGRFETVESAQDAYLTAKRSLHAGCTI
jgi:hypothetical protein